MEEERNWPRVFGCVSSLCLHEPYAYICCHVDVSPSVRGPWVCILWVAGSRPGRPGAGEELGWVRAWECKSDWILATVRASLLLLLSLLGRKEVGWTTRTEPKPAMSYAGTSDRPVWACGARATLVWALARPLALSGRAACLPMQRPARGYLHALREYHMPPA